jgi:selenocysteine lyase/cysteine desulfurase
MTISTTHSAAFSAARESFRSGPGYLAACTMGLPTDQTVDALQNDLHRWARAEVSPMYYDAMIGEARQLYADLVGVRLDRVAIGSQAAAQFAMIAASVPDGGNVLCVDGDFSSVVFPFLQHARRGVRVTHVPLPELADNITHDTSFVAFSLVQSATGQIAESERILQAAGAHGARVVCDTTQATGWLPVDASLFDATVCHTYKWLCAPRGVSFLTVSDDFLAELVPVEANWYAGDDPWESCYGPDIHLASDARRFDVSPAWQAWVGALPALRMFAGMDMEEVRAYDARLGNSLCEGMGLESGDQAIVTWPDQDGSDLRRLTEAGITASGRAGRARVAFHLWNDDEDVALALRALGR